MSIIVTVCSMYTMNALIDVFKHVPPCSPFFKKGEPQGEHYTLRIVSESVVRIGFDRGNMPVAARLLFQTCSTVEHYCVPYPLERTLHPLTFPRA